MKIKGSLAHIRHCYGVVIELVSELKTRERQLDIVDEYMEKGYNVYWLRHADNDWSKPFSISKKQILANRFGWFITRDEMIFDKNDEVALNHVNAMYYNFRYDKKSRTASIIDASSYPIDSFDVMTYFEYEPFILEAFKYYISKDEETAGIVKPNIGRYINNGNEVKGFALLTQFKSADTKPDYAPDFEGMIAINGALTPVSEEPIHFWVCKNRTEYIHDVFIFTGNHEENVDLKRTLEDYDVIIKAELIIENPTMLLKAIDEDPFKFLNLDYEDFSFSILSRYNKFFPHETMKLQNVAPSRVYSTKSDYTTNMFTELLMFYNDYLGK